MSLAAHIENCVITVSACALAYVWDSAYPLILMLFCNIPRSK